MSPGDFYAYARDWARREASWRSFEAADVPPRIAAALETMLRLRAAFERWYATAPQDESPLEQKFEAWKGASLLEAQVCRELLDWRDRKVDVSVAVGALERCAGFYRVFLSPVPRRA